MVEQKISLTLELPGSTLLSSQECEKNPKESYDEHKVILSYSKGKGKWKKEVKKLVTYKTRKPKTIKQVIHMSQEAYDNMIDTPNHSKFSKVVGAGPHGQPIRVWDNMSEHERLTSHFQDIAHDLGATGFSYEVLGD